MTRNSHPTPLRERSIVRSAILNLALTLIGPLLGLTLAAWGAALAPPWTGFSSLLYIPLAGLGLPLAVAAFWSGHIGGRQLLIVLAATVVTALAYLTLIGPRQPSGMTMCQPLEAPASYRCVSTSSDDPGYHFEFTLEGRSGWPIMRLTPAQPAA